MSIDNKMLRSPVIVFLTIASCVAGAPLQLEGENIGLGQAVYSQPELAAALARSYEALGEPDSRSFNAIGSGQHLVRQSRRGLDSLSGATFGESKRWDHPSRKEKEPLTLENSNWANMMNRMQLDSSAKRNFDEIDRTNFDSFVKRNLDEIDRTGWDSFVKRRSMQTPTSLRDSANSYYRYGGHA